jgi:hypothetical protein
MLGDAVSKRKRNAVADLVRQGYSLADAANKASELLGQKVHNGEVVHWFKTAIPRSKDLRHVAILQMSGLEEEGRRYRENAANLLARKYVDIVFDPNASPATQRAALDSLCDRGGVPAMRKSETTHRRSVDIDGAKKLFATLIGRLIDSEKEDGQGGTVGGRTIQMAISSGSDGQGHYIAEDPKIPTSVSETLRQDDRST